MGRFCAIWALFETLADFIQKFYSLLGAFWAKFYLVAPILGPNSYAIWLFFKTLVAFSLQASGHLLFTYISDWQSSALTIVLHVWSGFPNKKERSSVLAIP